MSALREEILDYINEIPDDRLYALRPLLVILADDQCAVESDLTDEERAIVAAGRAEYLRAPDSFVSLDSIL
jgi:hypothetical protein